MFDRIPPVLRGICIGTFISILLGLIYLVVLREPDSLFYLFAGLVFLGGPFIGGLVAARQLQQDQGKGFLISSSVTFGTVCMLFILAYLILPLFDRASVQLSEGCNENSGTFNPSPDLAYPLPGNGGSGVLVTDNAQYALVAVIDYKQPPFQSTLFLVDKSSNQIIQSLSFENDVIGAAIDGDTLYLFNDKIGYFIDARTGELEKDFLTMDNYGGLSASENPIMLSTTPSGDWFMETSAVITSWRVDGSVKSRRPLTFNGIALGCFIDGDTHSIAVIK